MRNFLQVNRGHVAETKLNNSASLRSGEYPPQGNESIFAATEASSRSESSLRLGKASNEHPLGVDGEQVVNRYQSGNEQVINRCWAGVWKYAAMVTLLLTLVCGQMWGAVDFTPSEIYNSGSGTTTSGISVSSTFSVSSGSSNGKKLCTSMTKEDAISMSSSAGGTYSSNYLEITVPSNCKITNVDVLTRSNGDSKVIGAAIYWTGTASSTIGSSEEIDAPARNSSDCTTPTSLTVPSNTRTIRLYRGPKIKNGEFSGSGTAVGGTSTFNIFGLSVTATGTVTHSLTNVTRSSGATTATLGSAYSATYAASSGYALPSTISVTIGGKDSTSACTWNNSTGALSIPARSVTGAIVVTIAGEAAAAGSGWGIASSDNSWTASADEMSGSGTVTKTLSLSANADLQFKIVDISGNTWYGNGEIWGGTKTQSVSSTGTENNCHLLTTEAGSYTFSFNTSTKDLTITYPNSYTFYYANSSSWSNVYVYKFTSNGSTGNNATWPGVKIATPSYTCGGTDYYAATSDGYAKLIFTDNSSQTGDMVVAAADDGKYVAGTGSSWSAFPTYSVTYNANGDGAGNATGTTGSVPTDASSPYACGSTVTVLGKNTLAKSGYTFTGWNTAPGGGGTSYAKDATFTISANTTLYAQWEQDKYTVTYDVNGGGSVTPTSATQATGGASLTLPTPTWSGYTFDGWYNAGTKIGNGGASYTPTADITLYAHWTDNISGKVFSFIDNNYGDKFKSFTGYGWVAKDSTGRSKTFTNASTGVEYSVSAGCWDKKNNAISALAKFKSGTTSMSIVIPTGKIATVKISYGAYNTDNKLTVGGNNQTALSTALTDGMTNVQVYNALKEVTLNSQKGTLTLGSSTGNIYIGRVSAVITGYTISYAAGTYGSGSLAAGTKTHGSNFTLSSSDDAFTRDGYFYDGWSTNADGSTKDYNLGGTYSTDAATTLYPHWVKVCTAPSALAASSATAKGITLTVTDADDTNKYDFYVSEDDDEPTSGSTPTHSVSSYKSLTITNLVAGTTYYAWARAVCSESNKSGWTALTDDKFTTSTVSADYTLSNVTKSTGATSGIGGSDFTATFSANTDYSLPSTVTVTIGGNAATSGTDYTWTVGTGTLTIPANKINGDIDITVNSVAAAPSNVAISGTYHYYPGETISLTATPTGGNGPKTYQWYHGGTADGNAIDGATSATFTKASCVVGDAGAYYCKVTCGGSASRWSDGATEKTAFNVKIMQFYLKNSGGSDISQHALTKVDATHATLSLSLTGGTTYKFRVTDGCNDWYGNSDETGMTSSNCTNWTMPHDADCKMTTNSKSATYTFNFDFSGGLLGSEMKVSIVYPEGNQAAGKVIYWDNSVLGWASAPWYRIGKSTHNNKTQMTLVPGTANLYKVTTTEYNGFEYWHIANNQGQGTGNIFWTKDNSEGSPDAITAAMGFEGMPATDTITITPTSSHATGGSSDNNNCEFYEYGRGSKMKTQTVTISDYSNGTITVNYVDTGGVARNFTSGSKTLAHTVKLTSITAAANTGYNASAVTINSGAYSENYVVTGATTVAASFTPQTYTITYKDQGDVAFSGSHADGYPTSHTYATETTLKSASKTGYTFGGWFGNSSCTADAMTSIGATSITADITLYAKWTADTYDITLNMGDHGAANQSATVAYDATALTSITHVTSTGYDRTGYFDGSTKVLNADGSFADDDVTGYITDGKWSKTSDAELTAKWSVQSYTISYKDEGNETYSGSNLASLPTSHTYGIATDFVNGVKSGYRFMGWYTDASCTISAGSSIGATAITANTTYYAKWAQLYTITNAEPSNGTITVASSAIEGETVSISAAANTGYEFDAWSIYKTDDESTTVSPAAATASTSFTMPAYGVTVNATFNEVTYALTYDKGAKATGSASGGTSAGSYKEGTTITTPAKGTLDSTGCTFRGWTDGTTFYLAGQSFSMPASDVELAAMWDAGSGGDCETTLFSTDFSDAAWSGITGICRTASSKDTTYNGITFHSNNSTAKPFVVDNSAGTLTWCNNNMGNNYWIAIPVTSVNGSITITVDNGSSSTRFNYAIKQETSVSGSPGSGTSSTSADPSTVTISNLDKSDYVVYLGRQGSSNTKLTSISITTPCANTCYTVSFANQTGFGGSTTLPSSIVGVPSGKKIVQPADPEASGYEFSGWYSDAACTSAFSFSGTITKDTTIYAKWCMPHTITWVVNGETYTAGTPTTETTDCDGITTMPTAPADNTLSGCANSFRGWSETNLYGEATTTQPADLFVTADDAPAINADKTFYAVFGTATSVAYVGTVLWSEDWTGESNNAKPSSPTTGGGYAIESGVEYDYVDGTGDNNATTKVATGTNAGGVSPELMVGYGTTTAGAFTVTGLPKKGAKELTLIFKRNNTTTSALTPSVSGEGYSISKVSGDKADTYVYTITCGAGSTFDLIFTGSTTKDKSVRVDDIVLKVKKDGATNYRCICPSMTVTPRLVTASTPIFITSAASKTVRSQDSLVIVGSGLAKNAPLSISSPASKFALKSGKNGTLTTDATGAIDTVAYIYYTPGEGDTSDGLDGDDSFTITDGTNSETVSTALIGRHLPANFVIAAKVEDKWYALPANMGQSDAASSRAIVEVEVNNTTTPDTATTTLANAYSLIDVPTAVHEKDSGDYVILWMQGKDKPLYGNPSNTQVGSSTKSVINNLDKDYWWLLTQKNTSITNAADAKYNVSVANGNTNNPLKIWTKADGGAKWGLYSSGSNIITEIRLLTWVSSAVDPTVYEISGTTSICEGDDATITMEDSEEGVTYHLYKDDVDQDDDKVGTGSALEWTVTAEGTYTVKVEADATYNAADMDGSAVISYKTATAIGTEPATAVSGHDGVNFTLGTGMVATGQGDLSYKWYNYSTSGGADQTEVDGATSAEYTTSKSAGTYYYKVEVTAACGSVKSEMITVTVDNKHLLTYDANGGSGAPDAEYRAAGTEDLSATEPTRTNYRFLGWNTEDDGTGDHYDAGASYTMGTSAVTLYAEWGETATLTWNLNVNTEESSIGTASKASTNARISNSTDMTNLANYGSLTITGSAKSDLTSKIGTPASYDADKYMYVTFDVPEDYEFVPTSISVKVQPVGSGEDKYTILDISDENSHNIRSTATKCDGTKDGKLTTVSLEGDETALTGTVTLKIYVYNYSGESTTNNCYRLGSPITIAGNLNYVCPERATITSPTAPQSIKLYTDRTKTLTVAATAYSSGTLHYQWKKDGVNIVGATSASHTVYGSIDGTAGETYVYTCDVTQTSPDACATVTSPAFTIKIASTDCGQNIIAEAVLDGTSSTSKLTGGTLLQNGLDGSGPYKLNGKPSWFGIKMNSNFQVGDSIIFKLKVGDWWGGASAESVPVVVFSGKSLAKEIYRTAALAKGTDNTYVRFAVTQEMIDDHSLTDTVMIWRSKTNDASCTECCTQNHQMYSVQVKRYGCPDIFIYDDAAATHEWSDDDNWIGPAGHGSGLPTSDDRIFINKSVTVDVATASAAEMYITDGSMVTVEKSITVGDVILETGSTLNIAKDGDDGITIATNSLYLKGGWNSTYTTYDMPRIYIDPASTLTKEVDAVNFDISVDSRNYYPFAVPFRVKVKDVNYANETLKRFAVYGPTGQYVIKEYDGARRAEKGPDHTNNWKVVPREDEKGADVYLEPGRGYIMTAVSLPSYGGGIIRIPLEFDNAWTAKGEQGTIDDEYHKNVVAVTAYTGEATPEGKYANKGWNLLGVPFMSCYTASEDMTAGEGAAAIIEGKYDFSTGNWTEEEVCYVNVPSHDFSEYIQSDITDPETVLRPGWCFFVQIDTTGNLTFLTADEAANSDLPIYAPKRRAEANKPTVKTGIILSDGVKSDKTTFLVSDKYSAAEYEINADLEKLFGNGYTLATYSISSETRLAYNALSNADAANIIPIGYRAPAEGEYTFSINPRYAENGAFESVNLIDYETGIVTDLLKFSYTFSTDRTQNDSRFALNVVKQKETPTGIENGVNGVNGANGVRKLLLDGKVYIIRGGQMYDATGRMVK